MNCKKIIFGILGVVIVIGILLTIVLNNKKSNELNEKNEEINSVTNEQLIVIKNDETNTLENTEDQTQSKGFDLSLKEYISGVYSNNTAVAGKNPPVIDTRQLATGKSTNATYTQDKFPIKVKNGDYVTYTFTVYNEGNTDGYVNKITNNIPKGLEFVYISEDGENLIACDSEGNSETLKVDNNIYELIDKNNTYWALDSDGTGLLKNTYNGESEISITCDVESYLGERKLLKAYDGLEDKNYNGESLESLSISVVLRVIAEDKSGTTIRSEATIAEAEDTNGNKQEQANISQENEDINEQEHTTTSQEGEEGLLEDNNQNEVLKDIDSEISNWGGKDGDKNYQDDEDYDNILLGSIDLALKSFVIAVSQDITIDDGEYITQDGNAVSDTNSYLRMLEVDTTKLGSDENYHNVDYKKEKEPITISAGSYVLYNIRVYNEGDISAYAGEIIHHLPEYIDYVYCDFNTSYGWQVSKGDAKTIVTDYLSYEQGAEKNLIKAFDRVNDDGKGTALDYRDVQILCKANSKVPKDTKLVNLVEISKYQDENGNDVSRDIDSAPNNVDKKSEDDDDYEQVIIETFDLSLSSWVSTVYVTEDGKMKTTQTGNTGDDSKDIVPKVEIDKDKVDTTQVKFGYIIKVTNEGDTRGYVKKITDCIPEGLQFYDEDNTGWTDEGNNVISTRTLENTLLKPGESAEVTVILRWINGSDNFNLKTNMAEISEDYNEEGIEDRDSILDNKKIEEDDIDEAEVLLEISNKPVIKTNTIIKIILVIVIVLVIAMIGIYLLKKRFRK